MKILTVIVTYNAMKWIDKCLSMLSRSTVPTDVIIIDNNSVDDTRKFIMSDYPSVIWRPQEKNLGFGQANNIGLKYALDNNYDYVLLLNQDAYLQEDALEKILAVCDGESLYSPMQMNHDGSRLDYSFKMNTVLRMKCNMIDDMVNGKCQPSYQSGEYCAACWFMPISIIRRIGGFNPLFFQYGEDNNYYQRLVFNGIKSYIVSSAFVYHDRMIHGNMEAYNSRLVEREMLIISTNINYNLSRIVRYFAAIAFCNWKHPIKNLLSLFAIILKTKRIVQSRIAERRQTANWL